MPDPVATARGFLGAPYKFGGNDASGIDCSGLVQQAYPTLPRTAADQFTSTARVSPDQLQAGDLVFLQGTRGGKVPAGRASHVGIYDGQGNVIAAPHTGGTVGAQPLSTWQGKSLLGYGRVSSMPKGSKSVGMAPSGPGAPGNPQVQTASPYDPAALPRNANGGIDLYSFLSGAMANRGGGYPQGAPSLNLYDPYSPTTGPNPAYNPTPQSVGGTDAANSFLPGDLRMANLAPQPGPVTPYDDRQTITTPSTESERQQAARDAQAIAPNPQAEKVAELKAHSDFYKSLQSLLQQNPAAQMALPDYLPFPDRPQPQIPTRPAPQYDLQSGILATLGGLIDPQSAGQYGTMPLQAGTQMADQQYADRKQQFQEQAQIMAQQYEHDLAARNDRAHYNQEKATVGFQNAGARRDATLAAGQAGLGGDQAINLAGSLGTIGDAQKQAQALALKQQLLTEVEQQQLGQNAARINYQLQNDKNANDIYKTFLSTVGRGYASDNHLAGQQIASDSRETVGAGHDAAHTAGIATQQAGANGRTAANNTARTSIADNNNTTAIDVAKIRANAAFQRGGRTIANPNLPQNFKSDLVTQSGIIRSVMHEADKQAGLGMEINPQLQARIDQAQSAFDNAQRRADAWLQAHPGANTVDRVAIAPIDRVAIAPISPAAAGQPGPALGPAGPPAAPTRRGPGGAPPVLNPHITGIIGPNGQPFTPRK